jgi:hypothetical protein
MIHSRRFQCVLNKVDRVSWPNEPLRRTAGEGCVKSNAVGPPPLSFYVGRQSITLVLFESKHHMRAAHPQGQETSLSQLRNGDAENVQIARRLRDETTVTLQWIAAALAMGTWTHVANQLSHASLPAWEATSAPGDHSPGTSRSDQLQRDTHPRRSARIRAVDNVRARDQYSVPRAPGTR